MSDFYQKISDMQGTFEDLVRKVPGFKGYFEMQDRRAADRLLREKLSRAFREQLDEFVRVQGRIVDAGNLECMERVRDIDVRFRTLIDKIESASQGYAGLFDAVKVDAAALSRVYAFDNALFSYQEQLVSGLQRLGSVVGSSELEVVLGSFDDLVSEISRVFARRVEVMKGLQDSV